MDVLVAGGHGKIALRLLRLLAAEGDPARGLIRNPGQAADLEALGAVAVLGDLEADASLPSTSQGADVLVFAAGAGPGSGPEREAARVGKLTVAVGRSTRLAVRQEFTRCSRGRSGPGEPRAVLSNQNDRRPEYGSRQPAAAGNQPAAASGTRGTARPVACLASAAAAGRATADGRNGTGPAR